jgi:cell wall assembly regulator SMI1
MKETAIKLYREGNIKCKIKTFNPITHNKIKSFENNYNVRLPKDFIEWLFIANGSNVGPGGFFGIETGRNSNDIEFYLKIYPGWVELKYIPIASDGCGNTYLIDLTNNSTNGFIFFIDSYTDINKLTYYVASNFWTFLYFILNREVEDEEAGEEDEWPFDKQKITSIDPEILKAPKEFLPWNLPD